MASRSPPPADDPERGRGRDRLWRLPLSLAPWLGMAAMAVLWPKRREHAGEPSAPTPADYDAAEPLRGRQAAWPWRIPPRGWKDIAWRTINEYGRTRLPALSGGVTFYLLLAIFPGIAASVSLFGLFSDVDTVEREFLHFSSVFPSDAINLMGDQMVRIAAQKQAALGVAFALSALVSVWSANAGMQALFDAVNVAYNEHEKRPWLLRVVMTYAATLASIVFVVAVASAALAVPAVLHAVGFHHLAAWWDPLRWLAILAAAVVAFTVLYRIGPSRRPARWRWLVPGGLFAAVLWMAGSYGFSWYLDTFRHLGVMYGSLGAIIGFMLWMWFSVMTVVLGAELNSEIEHQTACDSTIGASKPIGARCAVMADSVGAAFPTSPREMREISLRYLQSEARNAAERLRSMTRARRP